MTTAAWVFLAVTAVIAVVDWYAVQTDNVRVEYVAKPATMVALIAVALSLTPAVGSMRMWFVVALIFSMIGDVFLMLPTTEPRFIGGLASFLVGHIAYIAGLIVGGTSPSGIIIGIVLVFTALVAVGPTLIKGAKDRDSKLALPVALYMLTIGVMVTCAVGAGVAVGTLGALLFFASDFTIGWSRFVQDFPQAKIVIITTYHLAQILLVVSLVVAR